MPYKVAWARKNTSAAGGRRGPDVAYAQLALRVLSFASSSCCVSPSFLSSQGRLVTDRSGLPPSSLLETLWKGLLTNHSDWEKQTKKWAEGRLTPRLFAPQQKEQAWGG